MEIPGIPDAVEGVLGDRYPARFPKVRDRVFPQVTVEGRAWYAQQITDLIDCVDSPLQVSHTDILKLFLADQHVNTKSVRPRSTTISAKERGFRSPPLIRLGRA